MTNTRPLVEALGYIGGQDEDLGGYCEPLVIIVGGEKKFVLHEMAQYRDDKDINPDTGRERIKARHRKVEFGTREELTGAFGNAMSWNFRKLGWVETDSKCGYDIPQDDFVRARTDYSQTKKPN